MSATTSPGTPETELTPELIERVMKLSPENVARLIDLIQASLAEDESEPVFVVGSARELK